MRLLDAIIARLCHEVAARLRARVIEDETSPMLGPYLVRYAIRGWLPGDDPRPRVNVYLHRILRSDADDWEHNHPWRWAVSLVLAGGYDEVRGGEVRHLRAPALNVIRHDDFHRIVKVRDSADIDGCWTLFVTGPKMSSWGFRNPRTGEVTPWRERLLGRGIEPSY